MTMMMISLIWIAFPSGWRVSNGAAVGHKSEDDHEFSIQQPTNHNDQMMMTMMIMKKGYCYSMYVTRHEAGFDGSSQLGTARGVSQYTHTRRETETEIDTRHTYRKGWQQCLAARINTKPSQYKPIQ